MFDRDHVTDAIKFWERGRVLYNVALIAISIVLLVAGGIDTSSFFSIAIPLFMLGVAANVLYCAAYPIDLFVQASDFRDAWRSVRWGLLVLGTLVAIALAFTTLGGPHVLGLPGAGPHG